MNIDKYDSKEKVYKFLQEHAVAVLSTVSLDNIPSAAPIYFVPDEELNLYFMTKSDTVKAQNIENSDNDSAVAITVVDPEFPLTVQARGTISENNDPKYFGKLTELNALQKAGFHWPPPLNYKVKDFFSSTSLLRLGFVLLIFQRLVGEVPVLVPVFFIK